jgi:hypothetical protein
VLVHIHDVFDSFEYPIKWLNQGRAWNEQYLLHAFLQFNDTFEIVLSGHRMVTKFRGWFEQNMPLCVLNPGGSIWLRKVK